MKLLRLFIFGLVFMIGASTVNAQTGVTKVNYKLEYDTTTCLYDCYFIVAAGAAYTTQQRLQFNSQYSVVVPTGTTLVVDTTYAPIYNDANGDGISDDPFGPQGPNQWSISNVAVNPSGNGFDYYGIIPVLSTQSHYDTLTGGKKVKLFSLAISPVENCGSGIKLYENGIDPDSEFPGMNFADFSQGFTVGGPWQDYNTNATQLYPPVPLIIDASTECGNGIEIDLTATTSTCQSPLTYEWSGPAGYSGTGEDVSIPAATSGQNGDYKVVITDAFGCKDSVTVTATSKPDAGPDMVMCAGTLDTLQAVSPLTGTWSSMAGNPSPGASLAPLGGGKYTVTMPNAASGTYNFIYAIPGCTDTMSILVNPKPVVSINDYNICSAFTAQASPTTGGTWTSSNISVATINNAGLITAVAQGTCTFTFVADLTGCTTTTSLFTVDPSPTVTIAQDTLCVDATTTVTPSTGGQWTSGNTSILTITNTGVITAVSPGTTTVQFYENASGCYSATIDVVVRPKPVVVVNVDSICVNSTTQLLPLTGGTWSSSNTFVATIDFNGVVTGVNPGQAIFTFTDSSTGCVSEASDPITVLDELVVSINGDLILCIDETTTLNPSTGGIWTSNNTSVATVTPSGVVTAVGTGIASFTFVDDIYGCSATTGFITVDPRPSVSTSNDSICVGTTAILSPSTGGVWQALNPGIASLSANKTVTGVSPGDAGFIFTSNDTGCKSDTVFINVEPGPVAVFTGLTTICVGETSSITPNTGGTWTSSNSTIAEIDNFGIITGIAAGVVTFTYTDASTGCESEPSGPFTVVPRPFVTIAGDDELCIGETTQLLPNSGGTWTSTQPGVATVTNGGVVTAVSPGFASFYFTDAVTGCVSELSAPISVYEVPEVNFGGPDLICVGQTTNVLPSTGGSWVAANNSIVSVTNAGVVTGLAPGTTTLIWQATDTGCDSEPLTVTVQTTPIVSITGDDELCIGETSQLSPTTGGTWVSNNSSVATVTSGGVVTAIAAGQATFYFEADGADCPSAATDPIIVHPDPTVIVAGDGILCIDETTNATPNTGGTWASTDPTVASITNAGLITAIAPGLATFIFTNTATGCVSEESTIVEVIPAPLIFLNGPSEICVGKTTNFSPSVGGSWASTNTSIATITNQGLVTGIAPGVVNFIFTDNVTGCSSAESVDITVTPGPVVSIQGDDELCIGEFSQLSPSSGGTWVSSHPSIASVTNAGVVQAISAGSATFTFTSSVTGCSSEATDPIIVHGPPTVLITGTDVICVGGTTQLLPSSGGTWASSNTAVATVTDAGVVTGVAEGSATFIFTSSATNCPSLPTLPVSVSPSPDAEITGNTEICIGGSTTLSPSTGGVWTSSDPSIATVNNAGIVTAHAAGIVTFTFAETASGCFSSSATDPLTITNCLNPDFNATFVDVPVNGDASTNDDVPVGSTYGPNFVLTSSPAGSDEDLVLNGDGTYVFTANTVGVYVYEVPVCVPPTTTGCATAQLVITVTDYVSPQKDPIANVDIATTNINIPVTLATLANDRCVVTTGCLLDPATVSVTALPSRGTAVVNSTTGDITYTPGNNVIGKDTLRYTVCVDGEPTNCASALQIITINSGSALNSTVAADDFGVTMQGEQLTGNVSDNDSDPEGNTQTVQAVGYTVPAGTISINTDGSYTFDPAPGFFGPVDFEYTTCDNNANQACADATLHILVVRDLTIFVRVYLEGSLINNNNKTGTTHSRPLMRDNLRLSPFTASNYIPTQDPYTFDKYVYPLGQQLLVLPNIFVHQGCGTRTDFNTIPDPATVFAVTGEDAIVDWVMVELRSTADSTVVLASRAGLLQRDGDVADLDGVFGLRFPETPVDDYYVVVRHRNHFGAMTAAPQTPAQLFDLVDFTVETTGFYTFGTSCNIYDYDGLAQNPFIKTGYLCLWGGDHNADGLIKFINPNDDLNALIDNVFLFETNDGGTITYNYYSNFDFALGYQAGDFDMNSKAKQDNPNDDTNYLFGQLLFYPLNTEYKANFDGMIEQLPQVVGNIKHRCN